MRKQNDNKPCRHYPKGILSGENVDKQQTCARCGRGFYIVNGESLRYKVLAVNIVCAVVSFAIPFVLSSMLDKRYALSEQYALYPVFKFVAASLLLELTNSAAKWLFMQCATTKEACGDEEK